MALPTLVSKKKAADALDVSIRTIDRLRGRGELRVVRVGGQIRILEASIERYVERQLPGIAPIGDDFPIPVLVAMREGRAA